MLKRFGEYLQSLPAYCGLNVILIIDNSRVHLGLEDIETALKYNIHLVSLIKNTTSETQPLDKVMFGPFKRQLEQEKNKLIYKDGVAGRLYRLQKRDIVKCGTLAWRSIDTPKNRDAAFSSTGLWPFDPHIFDKKFEALRSVQPAAVRPSSLVSAAPLIVHATESTYDAAG